MIQKEVGKTENLRLGGGIESGVKEDVSRFPLSVSLKRGRTRQSINSS